MNPDVVAAVIVPTAACATIVLLGFRILAYKQSLARSAQEPAALAAVEQRLARVEVALDDLAAEFGRVIEGQQFLTKVLVERSAVAGALPGSPPVS